MPAGATDIALQNAQAVRDIFKKHDIEVLWQDSSLGHEWGNWRATSRRHCRSCSRTRQGVTDAERARRRGDHGALVCRRHLGYPDPVTRVGSLLGITVFLVAQFGSAQTKSANSATAEALFKQGRELMKAGKYAPACSKFEASQQLEPGLGTLLNLAECYEKSDRTASAWAEYRKAIPLARAAGSKARQDLATERAQRLEERLSTLTIRAVGDQAPGSRLEVRRDGVAVQSAELGSAIPVDPGDHLIEASAPGRQPWSSTIHVGPNADKVSVEIPQLASDAVVAPGPPAPPLVSAATTTSPPASDQPPLDGSAQRVTGVVLGGAGVVGIGLGTFFGLRAFSKWDEVKGACADYPYECGPESAERRSSASSAGTASTVAFIAGGALLATGMVLYVTAPSKKTRAAMVVGPSSVGVRGQF